MYWPVIGALFILCTGADAFFYLLHACLKPFFRIMDAFLQTCVKPFFRIVDGFFYLFTPLFRILGELAFRRFTATHPNPSTPDDFTCRVSSPEATE